MSNQKEVMVSDKSVIFPRRNARAVLGLPGVEVEDFNALFFAELNQASGLADGTVIQIPETAYDRLKAIVEDVLSGEIDNSELRFLIKVVVQTSYLNSTTWANFKVNINTILNDFQMVPEVVAISAELEGTEKERHYAWDRLCIQAIFNQTAPKVLEVDEIS